MYARQQGQVLGKDRVLPPRLSHCGQIGNLFFGKVRLGKARLG
jgi:hypothetical protein